MADFYMPTMGVKGLYALSEPFQTALTANMLYTCTAIRRVSDVIGTGADAFELYYAPFNISREKYEADLANKVCIVTLESDSGVPVYVPNSYMTMAPDIGGVPYQHLILAINISLVKADLDLSNIKDKIRSDVKDLLGVDSTVQTVIANPSIIFSQEQSRLVELSRQSYIAEATTDYAKLLAMTANYERAVQQIAELNQYIIDNPV